MWNVLQVLHQDETPLRNDGGGGVVGHGIDTCKEEEIASYGCEWTTNGYLPQVRGFTS
jgi:hypothetical protein